MTTSFEGGQKSRLCNEPNANIEKKDSYIFKLCGTFESIITSVRVRKLCAGRYFHTIKFTT